MCELDAFIKEFSICFAYKAFSAEKVVVYQRFKSNSLYKMTEHALYRDFIEQNTISLDFDRKLYIFGNNLEYNKETKLFRRISV